MTANQLVLEAVEGTLTLEHVDAAAQKQGADRASVFNSAAIFLARQFESSKLDYSSADRAINLIWGLMIADASQHGSGFELAQPAFSIYEAFDAGEYHDTTLSTTRLRIQEILRNV